MRVLISGASGFLGSALHAHLTGEGHEVQRLVRRPAAGPDERRWDPYAEVIDLGEPEAVINVSGAGVGDRRWTAGYKRIITESRVKTTSVLAHAMAAAPVRPRVLINQSAVGYYGDTGDRTITEDAPPGEGFLPGVCRAWEAATHPAEDAGIRVCRLRTGLPLAASGGLLPRMLPVFKAGLGGRLGSGRQYMPWISLADWLGAVSHLLAAEEVSGPVNMTGPEPVTNAEFTRALGSALHRPAVLAVPGFALRVAVGELAGDALGGQRAMPVALDSSGYTFMHSDLKEALTWAISH
ncbi:TIGR01777 family oxidoreductase [Longispora albida]|uniref:TIGR01777 family oxidoreductase n=1 Tax=Longispora albida TaxID=203523 RepID=UPI0003764E8D|nr:TIGR01777 family oxidoreductase [Longispora albida]